MSSELEATASNDWQGPVGRLRLIGWIEGISFLLLLGVAMPLKYLAGIPMAVKVVGWAHGVLFLALVYQLVHTSLAYAWPIRRGLMVIVAALIPFGPFVIDSRLRTAQRESLDARVET